MRSDSTLLAELSILEGKLHQLCLILPEASIKREGARNRSYLPDSDFTEWDNYCKSLDRELGELLRLLDKHLKAVNWKRPSLPSPYFPDLWNKWWQKLRETETQQLRSTMINLVPEESLESKSDSNSRDILYYSEEFG